ncbi:MAG: hypothetical protein AB7S26_01065 [Sandaracinaceae bacterium]
MTPRRILLVALPVALGLFASAASAQEDEEEQPAENATDADGEAEEGGGYEPDQRGYEPDQRGETDGGGRSGEPQSGGDGGETGDGYEPDQRGEVDGEDEEAEAPAPMSADSAGGAEAAYDSDELGFDLRLALGAGANLLDAIEDDNFARDQQRGGFGGGFALTLGLRLDQVTFGPRFGVSVDPSISYASFGFDVIGRLTSDRFAPYVRGAVSYALAFSFTDPLPSQSASHGILTELALGFGGRIVGPMTLGAELSVGWLALFRNGADPCVDPCAADGLDLSEPGHTHGLVLRGSVYVGAEL